MYSDVVQLRRFYDSCIGSISCQLIGEKLHQMWPNTKDMEILGVGYATPYLTQFFNASALTCAAMPELQGAIRWPKKGLGLVTLIAEDELPFPDRSFDRLLVVHGLENCENLQGMPRESWRILKDGGRIISIVPNCRGVWSRLEQRSPFGRGNAYSSKQIQRLFCDSLFEPLRTENALFLPPIKSKMIVRSALAIEKFGYYCFRALAGVLIIEASKQVYASTLESRQLVASKQRLIGVPNGNAVS